MRRSVVRIAMAGLTGVFLMALLSCGQDQRLVAVLITPNDFTYTNPQVGLLVTFTARGQFVHPPETRDISASVVWNSPFAAIFTVDPITGVANYVGGCGTNLTVSATASSNLRVPPAGNIVTGAALVNIVQKDCTA